MLNSGTVQGDDGSRNPLNAPRCAETADILAINAPLNQGLMLCDKRPLVATGNLVNHQRRQRQGALIHRGEGLAAEHDTLAGTDKPVRLLTR